MKVKESTMVKELNDLLMNLSPVEFVEEYNRQMGADLIVDDIEWDGMIICQKE